MHRNQPSIAHATVLSLLVVLTACGEDHTEGVSRATVASGAAPAATQAAEREGATPATTLTIDRATSSVGFTAAKVTASHDGSFTDFSGTIELPGADPTAGRVNVTIVMGSLVIEPARLASHLRTPDLLDVTRFPTATFESTSIVAGSGARIGDAAQTHTVTGDLTLHGQTRTITFPAAITVADDAVTASAEFVIDRQDFGVTYPGMPDDLIRDDVVIRFRVRAPRSASAASGG